MENISITCQFEFYIQVSTSKYDTLYCKHLKSLHSTYAHFWKHYRHVIWDRGAPYQATHANPHPPH